MPARAQSPVRIARSNRRRSLLEFVETHRDRQPIAIANRPQSPAAMRMLARRRSAACESGVKRLLRWARLLVEIVVMARIPSAAGEQFEADGVCFIFHIVGKSRRLQIEDDLLGGQWDGRGGGFGSMPMVEIDMRVGVPASVLPGHHSLSQNPKSAVEI